jgi:hypothetical protein
MQWLFDDNVDVHRSGAVEQTFYLDCICRPFQCQGTSTTAPCAKAGAAIKSLLLLLQECDGVGVVWRCC